MAFVQRAQGNFSINVSGDFHCGPDHTSPKTFPYSVEIHYPASALDENGFLLDNQSFQQYFDGLGHTDLSCERLTMKAATDLHAATNGRCHSTRVNIWAIPGHAAIECIVPDVIENPARL